MKILLTSPFMSYENRWGQYYKGAGDTFPQGIGSIAGYMEKNGIMCDIIEPDILGMTLGRFKKFIQNNNYSVVGISAFTPNIVFAYDTAKLIKLINPEIKIVLGGSHPTIFPQKTLEECDSVDYVITNEGEVPFLLLIKALEQRKEPYEIPNLYFRQNGEIHYTGKVVNWLDLNELPIFPYHKFDLNYYIPAPSLRKVLPTFNYMAQRGCPFECAFCDTRTHGKRVRYRSVERVIDDLKFLKANYRIRGLIFEGSNFTANPDWIKNLCSAIIKENINLSWYSMGRIDFDIDLLPLMKQSGLWCMGFGIESANPHTLKRMKKQITPIQVKETLQALKKLKIKTIGSFILGYPGENKQDILNTIDYACSLPLDIAVFFNPVPFPGTELYEDVKKNGGMKSDIIWKDYSAWLDHNNPIYINPLIGEEHIHLYNYAIRKFYVRPYYIFNHLLNIRSIQDAKRLFQGLKSILGLIKKSGFG